MVYEFIQYYRTNEILNIAEQHGIISNCFIESHMPLERKVLRGWIKLCIGRLMKIIIHFDIKLKFE